MATIKITEKEIASSLNKDAYVLVTQQESDGQGGFHAANFWRESMLCSSKKTPPAPL